MSQPDCMAKFMSGNISDVESIYTTIRSGIEFPCFIPENHVEILDLTVFFENICRCKCAVNFVPEKNSVLTIVSNGVSCCQSFVGRFAPLLPNFGPSFD